MHASEIFKNERQPCPHISLEESSKKLCAILYDFGNKHKPIKEATLKAYRTSLGLHVLMCCTIILLIVFAVTRHCVCMHVCILTESSQQLCENNNNNNNSIY